MDNINQTTHYNQKHLAIYIATHKEYTFFNIPEFLPIQVGKAISHTDLGFISDDSGENISHKNKTFCELTALYWIWKNADAEFLGLYHYRRYLGIIEDNVAKILAPESINRLLDSENTIIMPEESSLDIYNVKSHYKHFHHIADWNKLENIITTFYPDYLDAFHSVENKMAMHITNIMVAHRSFFNRYCNWLFDILFKLEEIIDISEYDDYQKRVFGFLSERLLNIFLEKHRLEYKIISLQSVNIPEPQK